ncbi:MAG TPA: dehydrogenase E1 component subunit alpha/beta [Candidatus Kapabacteria bacterium]|nr:dehydrogenase E1 component subunit alpha/beta [Candidatus Kapabacteria bacterium]
MASKRSRQSAQKNRPDPVRVLGKEADTATADVQEAFDEPTTAGAAHAPVPVQNGLETSHESLGLDLEPLRAALRTMMLARRTDEKHLMLLKQNKSYFHIGVSGHEAIQVGIAHWMNPERDWAWTYYRDLAIAYAMGHTPKDHFLGAFAKTDDPASGGRQMPCHHGNRRLHLPTQSSPTGTQFLNAVGCALASVMDGTDEVTYVAAGEGTTSQGEFYEAVNWASRAKLPVIFCIQDNGYAISVPSSDQVAGGPVGKLFENHPNLEVVFVDGTDMMESYRVGRRAVERARRGEGPTLIHASVVRLLAHSSSDDQRKYRDSEELAAEQRRDPILRLSQYLVEHGMMSQEAIDRLQKEVYAEIDEAADWAVTQADPDPATSTRHNWADERDLGIRYEATTPSGEKAVLVDAINHAMHEEMAHNERMLIFGEDVADNKGGVFTATRGLTNAFGADRVFNSPLAEASIVGVALGLATRGYKPCVEIQFGDYIWPAFQQLRNEVATLRYRSNDGFSCPMVVRVAVGGYIHGGLYHSQNIEAFFSHIPGLYVAYPSTAADAKGLLKTACRMDDPVIFCEHKGLYRMPFSSGPEPDADYFVEFGKGRIVRAGDALTVVTWGAMVKECFNAAKRLEAETGRTTEIIDLRTIVPWDRQMVLSSVAKTGRAVVVHEDTITMGFGAEIAAVIAREAFEHLDAPVERVAAKDSHIPYHPVLEVDVLPTEEKIFTAFKRIVAY